MKHAPLARHRPLPSGKPLRILIGPKEIGGQIPDYAAGFRALGHQVTTVIREPHPFFPDLRYDVDLSRNTDPSLLLRLVEEHDVFLFQYGESLVAGSADLPAIRNAGKAIIAVCNGDDVRHGSAYSQEFGVPAATMGEFYVNDPIARSMQTLRLMERYASVVVSVPNQSGLALRPYVHFAYAIDMSLYEEHINDREVPVLVHAPSDRAIKGTAEILASLERLSARGVAFELKLLEGLPNAAVREALRDADVAIDQLFMSYGKFASEAMASGCAVACVTYPDIEPFATLRPLHHIDADGIDAQLERLLTDRALRRTLAEQGRPHVARYHDRTAVCARMLETLHAAVDGSIRYDYYPTFFAERYSLSPRHELSRAQRIMASDIVAEFGAPAGADILQMARRGLLDAHQLAGTAPILRWSATDGIVTDVGNPAVWPDRWTSPRLRGASATSPTAPVVAPPARDRLLDSFFAQTTLTGTSGGAQASVANSAQSIERGAFEMLRMGNTDLALSQILPLAGRDIHARRAAALLLLGSGQFADARDLLDTLRGDDADGIVTYYLGVAQVLAGDVSSGVDTISDALTVLPRHPEVHFFGCTPILSNRYWAMALQQGGAEARTLMSEYYGSINQRSDYDHYFTDLSPVWTSGRWQSMLAPYHAFLFLLLTGRTLHTSFEGGPLAHTPLAPVEPALLKRAGIKTVVIGYGGDCTVYANVRDASHRHVFLASYPQAARDERRIRDRLDRWNADADCIVSTLHSLDGHGRWDVLIPSPFQIDTALWSPVTRYSEHDGRSGPVRVMHTPNHRGYKGTEFLLDAVTRLRAEGLDIELDLLEGVQNAEVRARMQQTDILAEQFIYPLYALSGIEGMASGIPVMANTADPGNQVFRRYSFLDECPVVGTTIEQIVPNLRRLVTDPSLRRTLGVAGRRYAEKYHSFASAQHLFGAIHASIEQTPNAPRLIDLYHPLLGPRKDEPRIDHPLVGSQLPA